MRDKTLIDAYYTEVWNDNIVTQRSAVININTGLVLSISFSKIPATQVWKHGLRQDAYIEWNDFRLELTFNDMLQVSTIIPDDVREQMKMFIERSEKE